MPGTAPLGHWGSVQGFSGRKIYLSIPFTTSVSVFYILAGLMLWWFSVVVTALHVSGATVR